MSDMASEVPTLLPSVSSFSSTQSKERTEATASSTTSHPHLVSCSSIQPLFRERVKAFPSSLAEEVATEGLRVATAYYNLFIQERGGLEVAEKHEKREEDDREIHRAWDPLYGTKGKEVLHAAGEEKESEEHLLYPLPPINESDKELPERRGITVPPSTSSSSLAPATSLGEAAAVETLEGRTCSSCAAPLPPLDDKTISYSSFFPPVSRPEVRKRILWRILGGSPRRFSAWKWRTASEFATILATHDAFLKHVADRREGMGGLTSVAHINAVAAYGDRIGGPNSPVKTGAGATRREEGNVEVDDGCSRLPSPPFLLGPPLLIPEKYQKAVQPSLGPSSSTALLSADSTPHKGSDPKEEEETLLQKKVVASTTWTERAFPSSSSYDGHDAREVLKATVEVVRTSGSAPVATPPPLTAGSGTWRGGEEEEERAAVVPLASGKEGHTHTLYDRRKRGERAAMMASSGPLPATSSVEPSSFSYSFPTSHQGPQYFTRSAAVEEEEAGTAHRVVIVMVGLPARGKTFLAQKICRLLGWHGERATVYNIQAAWRQAMLHHLAEQEKEKGEEEEDGDVEEKRMDRGDRDPTGSRSTGAEGGYPESTATSRFPPRAPPTRRAPLIRAEHFYRLLADRFSVEREKYRYVLDQFAHNGEEFFVDSGRVIVLNDDFIAADLRKEVEDRFASLGSHFFYIERIRESSRNREYNEFKVLDEFEYPPSMIEREEARKDFEERLRILEAFYEPLDGKEERAIRDPLHASTSSSTTTALPRGASPLSSSTPPRHSPPAHYITIRDPSTIEVHGIEGYLSSRIVSYLMTISQRKIQHPIYFVRHGQSWYNVENRIGGDPWLTAQGIKDSAALLEFVASLQSHLEAVTSRIRDKAVLATDTSLQTGPLSSAIATVLETSSQTEKGATLRNEEEDGLLRPCDTPMKEVGSQSTPQDSAGPTKDREPRVVWEWLPSSLPERRGPSHGVGLEIWTSQLRCAIQTAELSERLLGIKTLRWSSLNEIHAGVCEDMTYTEVRRQYEQIDQFRGESKYTFRYPGGGESYQDLVLRLEPVIMELENAEKVVIVVAHQAILRCLLAYFGSVSAESSIHVEVPHRVVWRCTYDSKGVTKLDEVALDNFSVGEHIDLSKVP